MGLRDPRKLAAMAYDGMGTFELGIVSEVFGLSRPELNVPWYEFRVFSLDRAPLRGTGGIRVQAPHGMGVLRSAGTIIVPGWHVDEAPPEALLRRLRARGHGAAGWQAVWNRRPRCGFTSRAPWGFRRRRTGGAFPLQRLGGLRLEGGLLLLSAPFHKYGDVLNKS